MAPIRGLAIGQAITDPDDGFRVVAIDPDLNTVETEDSAGTVLFDTIDHFIASHALSVTGTESTAPTVDTEGLSLH